ncbi:Tn3 family transposase [Mesorhizobium sp. M0598]|uniref:Tn3 family transposase n=1 Tax=Mesorhizobium sp. M0598 TaxID=2956968 RepID=UPI0033368D04
MRLRNGNDRRANGSRPRPSSPLSSARGSSANDETGLAHRIPDSPHSAHRASILSSARSSTGTLSIERAVTHLRKMRREIPDLLLKHISPLSWEHINQTGIYTWDAEHQMPEGFRSLRLPVRLRHAA